MSQNRIFWVVNWKRIQIMIWRNIWLINIFLSRFFFCTSIGEIIYAQIFACKVIISIESRYRGGVQRGVDFTIVQSVFAVHHTHRHRHCHHCHRFAYAAPTRERTFACTEWKVDRNTTISYNLWLVGGIKCSKPACIINYQLNTILYLEFCSDLSFVSAAKWNYSTVIW